MSSTAELNRLQPDDVLDTRDSHERVAHEGAATEDYSLRRVPASWRWSAWSALWSYSGLSTCMAFPLTAGLLSLYYGAPATLIAFVLTFVYSLFGVYYFTRKSAEEGTLEVLMSRQSFGFVGATYQLIAYGLIGAVYFALEGHVMASALSEVTHWPQWIAAGIICAAFIPLSIYGMRFLSVFQSATVWLYVLGMLAVLYVTFAGAHPEVSRALAGDAWWQVNPGHAPLNWVTVLSAFGATSGVLGAILILLCTEQARFARRRDSRKAGLLMSVVGTGFGQLVAPLLGIYLFACTGGKIPDPGVSISKLLGSAGLTLVVLTQLRINVINVYFGVNALQNVAATAAKLSLGRTVFILPFLVICYGVILSPWLEKFGTIMTMLSVFLVNWANVMLGEFWLVRRRYAMPAYSEIRRGYLPAYNRIGLLSMWIPTAIGVVLGSGSLGVEAAALAVPLTGLAAFLMPSLVASTMGPQEVVKAYFPRVPVGVRHLPEMVRCPIEKVEHHRSDFVQCPYHGNQFISSTACAAERGCQQMCLRSERTVLAPAAAN